MMHSASVQVAEPVMNRDAAHVDDCPGGCSVSGSLNLSGDSDRDDSEEGSGLLSEDSGGRDSAGVDRASPVSASECGDRAS
jgi:hypothetical protein